MIKGIKSPEVGSEKGIWITYFKPPYFINDKSGNQREVSCPSRTVWGL